jgi:hypothetical protein
MPCIPSKIPKRSIYILIDSGSDDLTMKCVVPQELDYVFATLMVCR